MRPTKQHSHKIPAAAAEAAACAIRAALPKGVGRCRARKPAKTNDHGRTALSRRCVRPRPAPFLALACATAPRRGLPHSAGRPPPPGQGVGVADRRILGGHCWRAVALDRPLVVGCAAAPSPGMAPPPAAGCRRPLRAAALRTHTVQYPQRGSDTRVLRRRAGAPPRHQCLTPPPARRCRGSAVGRAVSGLARGASPINPTAWRRRGRGAARRTPVWGKGGAMPCWRGAPA